MRSGNGQSAAFKGVPSIPLEVAVSLAAYVAYNVKRTVKDVGLDTDIMVIKRNTFPRWVEGDEISEMEAKFEEYKRVERESLYYCLGGNLTEQEQFFDEPGDHKRRQKSLRRFFEKLNSARLKLWTRRQSSDDSAAKGYACSRSPSAFNTRPFSILEAFTIGFGINAHSSPRLQT
jgi:hypothetical protein